jgi:hypothetical protein
MKQITWAPLAEVAKKYNTSYQQAWRYAHQNNKVRVFKKLSKRAKVRDGRPPSAKCLMVPDDFLDCELECHYDHLGAGGLYESMLKTSTMTFSQALEALKKGEKITRAALEAVYWVLVGDKNILRVELGPNEPRADMNRYINPEDILANDWRIYNE